MLHLLFDQQSTMEFLESSGGPYDFHENDTLIDIESIGTSRGVATKSWLGMGMDSDWGGGDGFRWVQTTYFQISIFPLISPT